MDIFISDLNQICNRLDDIDAMRTKLRSTELARYLSFKSPTRALQFLVAHATANDCAPKFKYTSISHRKNIVIVAASNTPVGIDIEDTSISRDFESLSQLMEISHPRTPTDFYRNFTRTEAMYKIAPAIANKILFYTMGRFIICVATIGTPNIRWHTTGTIPKQA